MRWEVVLDGGDKIVEEHIPNTKNPWLRLKDSMDGKKILRMLFYNDDDLVWKSSFNAPGFFYIKKADFDFTTNICKQYFGVGEQKDDFIEICWFDVKGKMVDNEKRSIEKCGIGYIPSN